MKDILTLLLLLPLILEARELPPVAERLHNQQAYWQGISISGNSAIEQISFSLNNDEEATVSLNTFRLLNKKADYSAGYRQVPWQFRNVQLTAQYPTGADNADNGRVAIDWYLFKQAHKWDESWDKYYPEFQFNQTFGDTTGYALQMAKIAKADQLVNDLLLQQGLNGWGISLAVERTEGQWNQVDLDLLWNHQIQDFVTSARGGSIIKTDEEKGYLRVAGQLTTEIWQDRWQTGGLNLLANLDSGPIEVTSNQFTASNWQLNLAAALPITTEARGLITASWSKDGSSINGSVAYNLMSK